MSIGLTLFYCFVATILDKHCNPVFGCFNQLNVPYMWSWALGLVFGDWKTGMIVGAVVNTLNMAPVVIGAVSTMNLWFATVVMVALVVGQGMDIDMAFAIASPMAILGNALNNLQEITCFDVITDNLTLKAAEKGDVKGIIRVQFFVKWLCSFVFLFIEYFVIIYVGTRAADTLLNAMPAWLINGFIASGKLLPSVGFGIFLAVLGKKKFIPFYIMGAYMGLYMGLSSMKIGVLAVCIGIIYLYLAKDLDNDLLGGNK